MYLKLKRSFAVRSIVIGILCAVLLLTGCNVTENPSATPADQPSPTPDPAKRVSQSHVMHFTNELDGIYNYCPSIMQMPDGTLYIYYCTNRESYVIVDHIGMRKGTRNSDGSISWGEEVIVLSPTDGAWDSMHACDPSVIAGEFVYGGETYNYLMAYLGCVTKDNQDNEVGIAVAKSPEGPFIKVDCNPIIKYEHDDSLSMFQWGVGQPSVVSIDKKGQVWIFYSIGDKKGYRVGVDAWDLSNLDAPILLSSNDLPHTGLKTINGRGGDYLNNPDVVYDENARRFYVSSDAHPHPSDDPNYVSSHFRVSYFDKPESFSKFKWTEYDLCSPDMTGFARNHNTGILRNEYGHLVSNGYLTVFYTGAIAGKDTLWSYRIHNYNLALPE